MKPRAQAEINGPAGAAGGKARVNRLILLFYPRQYSFEPRGDILRFFQRFPIAFRPIVLFLSLAVGAVMVPGVLMVKPDIYSLDVISPSNERVRDHRFIEERVGRYVPLGYTVEVDTNQRAISCYARPLFRAGPSSLGPCRRGSSPALRRAGKA